MAAAGSCSISQRPVFALPDGVERAHHTNIFDIDEKVLPLGAAVLAETARRFLVGDLKLAKDN